MTKPVRVGIMLPSRETAMTGQHDARVLNPSLNNYYPH
jgi:hypothetical protein